MRKLFSISTESDANPFDDLELDRWLNQFVPGDGMDIADRVSRWARDAKIGDKCEIGKIVITCYDVLIHGMSSRGSPGFEGRGYDATDPRMRR